MSWVIRYEVLMHKPLKAEDVDSIARYGPKLSQFSSGFQLKGVAGEKLLRGSTQPSGDWRTVDDVCKILVGLLKAEVDFSAVVHIENLFGDGERVALQSLDLEAVQRRLKAEWGNVDLGLEGDEDEEDEPPGRPGAPRRDSTSMKKIDRLLASARADFEVWKRSKGTE